MIKERASLQTDGPVIPINNSGVGYVGEVGKALRKGVPATADARHPGFYEVEIGDHWYYVHVSARSPRVYLVAVERVAARHCA